MILDVGEKTVELISNAIINSKTLLWNGPLGVFEIPPFDQSTSSCALTAAMMTRAGGLLSVAGGGDTVAALNNAESFRRFFICIRCRGCIFRVVRR